MAFRKTMTVEKVSNDRLKISHHKRLRDTNMNKCCTLKCLFEFLIMFDG